MSTTPTLSVFLFADQALLHCLCFELAIWGDLFDCVLTECKFTNTHRHLLHPQCHRLSPPARSPPLPPPSPTLQTWKNYPDSDIVIVSFGMQVHFPLLTPFNREKLPHSPDKQLTSLVGSSSYVAPEVIKNTGYRESCWRLVDRYDRFHTHTQTKHELIALSLHRHHHLRSPLQLSLFSCRQHHCPRPA